MNVKYVNPFIESVQDLFTMMLGCEAKRGNIGVASENGNSRDVVALIGLSGPASGMLTISFPVETALAIASRMLGMETKVMDDSVSDTVAEIVNIIGGGAKAKFTEDDQEPIDLGLPTVVRGNSYTVDYPTNATWLEVPFTSDVGSFSMRVTFKSGAGERGGE
jgi:chemotaxis protein CheX